jgi:hypothetical protein
MIHASFLYTQGWDRDYLYPKMRHQLVNDEHSIGDHPAMPY